MVGIADIIIDENKGFLIEKENVNSLANAITEILETDKEQLNRNLNDNYKYSFNKYNINNNVQKHYEIL